MFLLKFLYKVSGDIGCCFKDVVIRRVRGGFCCLFEEANAEELTLKLYWEGPGHCRASEYWLIKGKKRVSKMKGEG